jgi:hypothetical protein
MRYMPCIHGVHATDSAQNGLRSAQTVAASDMIAERRSL